LGDRGIVTTRAEAKDMQPSDRPEKVRTRIGELPGMADLFKLDI